MNKRLALIIFIGMFISACVGVGLGDRLSLNFIQIKAKADGIYCYISDAKDKFCMKYEGPHGEDIK